MNIITTLDNPNFQNELRLAIKSYYKQEALIREIDYIEHGSDNMVAIVNKELVFRFPRTEVKARRIAFETAILQKLKERITSVNIPQIVEVHTAPLYLVARYIPGNQYSAEQIATLHESDRENIGRQVAEFMHQFNQAVSGLEVRRLRTASGVDTIEEPWPEYFKRIFINSRLPNEKLGPFVVEYYTLWQQYVGQEDSNYAIHDDLHLANLLFSANTLTGIVDFGDANTGSIESELRWLYGLDQTILGTAIDHYQALSGQQINVDHIRVWAIMHELSTFTDRLGREDTNGHPFQRAQSNLRKWIPQFPL